MTSRISLVNMVKEEFRHHIVSMFAVVLTFLAEILFFYFEIQRLLQYENTRQYYRDVIAAAAQPSFSAMVPTMILAVLLSVEYFSYLHSQKKMDFYMSLPIKRNEQFWMGNVVCGIIFLVPRVISIGIECMIGYASGYGTGLFLQNMAWNLLCNILVFLAFFMTMNLAMIMTGNLVVAVMGFGAFCCYVPIFLKWILPTFEGLFYDTYAGTRTFSDVWDYFSPASVSYGLVNDYINWTVDRHANYLVAILVFVVCVTILANVLYMRRPAEAAGRAMAFQKFNSAIRFLIVVPIALYCGYFLRETAPDGSLLWVFVGVIIGTVLLHGIVESIFRFDLRGMLAKKKQLVVTILAGCVFILIFYLDITKYDEFVPDVSDVECASVTLYTDEVYFYDNAYSYEEEMSNTVSGETLEKLVELAEAFVEQNKQESDDLYDEWEWITIQYQMKDGSVKARQYEMNIDKVNDEIIGLLDEIFVTEDFKEDYYALYGADSADVIKITLDDAFSAQKLLFSEEKEKEFLEIYLQELTDLSFSEMRETAKIARFTVEYEGGAVLFMDEEQYDIYENFDKTVAYLKENGITLNSPLDECEVLSVEFQMNYSEETGEEIKGFIVDDRELLEEVKDELILTDFYHYGYVTGIKDVRYATIEIRAGQNISCYDVFVRPETENKLENAAKYTD